MQATGGKDKQKLTGQENTHLVCPFCSAWIARCLCQEIPRLELSTRICLVIHHRELTRSSNTGLLAVRALVNSEVRVRGQGREALDLKNLLTPCYRTFLFYPSDDAVVLDRALIERESLPIQLIVPDGTWRQARKIHTRHHELKGLQRVKVGPSSLPVFQLRAQSSPERMATLQAIARALGVIEGETVAVKLMTLYHAKIEQTLSGRGILRPKQWNN